MTILLDHIGKSYNGKPVLHDVNVTIEDGKCYAFVGPKGCGKTTALKIFMELEKPDEGAVVKLGDYKYPTLQSIYVSQEGRLNPKKNAVWNIRKMYRRISKYGAAAELSRYIPEEKQKIPVMELSPLERKLVEYVGAFLVPADFVVLDEPFDGMDEKRKAEMLAFILEAKGNRPLLIAQESEEGLDFARKIRLN